MLVAAAGVIVSSVVSDEELRKWDRDPCSRLLLEEIALLHLGF